MDITIKLTAEEDQVLTPYAALVKTTVAELVAQYGLTQAVQLALRAYVDGLQVKDAVVPEQIQAAILRDSNAIWTAVDTDWRNQRQLAGIIHDALAARARA